MKTKPEKDEKSKEESASPFSSPVITSPGISSSIAFFICLSLSPVTNMGLSDSDNLFSNLSYSMAPTIKGAFIAFLPALLYSIPGIIFAILSSMIVYSRLVPLFSARKNALISSLSIKSTYLPFLSNAGTTVGLYFAKISRRE